MVDYKIIGDRIRNKRHERQMTQDSMAEQLGVVAEYISKLENGKAKINLPRLEQIATLLNTPIEFFLIGSSCTSESYLDADFSELIHGLDADARRAALNILREIHQLQAKD